MSVLSQEIFRKGVYFKAISNRQTYNAATLNAAVPMGAGVASSQFATYSTDRIIINESARYKITYSFLAQFVFFFTPSAFGQIRLEAGSTIIGTASGFGSGTIDSNDFGLTSFYRFSDDTLVSPVILAGSTGMTINGYFNKTVELNLNANDEILFRASGTNLSASNLHTFGFDGYIIVEQIS